MKIKCDALVIGAGFSGLVVAERLARAGLKSVIVDRRNHVGGNCADAYDENGVLYHRYGPHYFRTNSQKIFDYLSSFTEWKHVQYKVLSFTDGQYWSFPINLKTYRQMYGVRRTEIQFERYIKEKQVPIQHPANSEEIIISQIGWELYKKFFYGYTLKQWKRPPAELSSSVCGRIPIRTNADDRYFSDTIQALPNAGYSRMFENILESIKGASLILNTSYTDIKQSIESKVTVFSGPIDEFFQYKFGHLPYRSLEFRRTHYTKPDLLKLKNSWNKKGFYQPALQVNYPNDELYTRTVEIKHVTGQRCEGTTIVKEYPIDYSEGKEPFYPVPSDESARIYEKYRNECVGRDDLFLIGRLGCYRYYNMDQVVAMALKTADDIINKVGCNRTTHG